MMRLLCAATLFLTVALVSNVNCEAGLIAGWDFQTTATGGTAILNHPDTPRVFTANFGSGTLYLDGSNGSSVWQGSTVDGFAGTTVNAGMGFSNVTTDPAALGLTSQSQNGSFAVFRLNMTGLSDLQISYASRRSGSGFNLHRWAWSTDGTNYTNFHDAAPLTTSLSTTFGSIQLPNLTALNGVSNAFLRITFSGATTGSGTNSIDNIQFNAVPEPTSLIYCGLVSLVAGGLRRRRRV